MKRLLVGCLLALALVPLQLLATQALPQERPFPTRPGGEDQADEEERNVPYDGRFGFVFVRLRYTMEQSGGRYFRREPPWHHDYPRAERHFGRILKEITLADPYLEGGNILTLDDPALCDFPIAYMSEPGFWGLNDREATGLRNYLRKGGFVIFDDFRGPDLENFETALRRVLPDARLVELDATHPIFHSFFEIESLAMVQFYDRGTPVFYGVFEDNDPKKRLMLIANYNNDIGEYWEWSDTGVVPIDLSNEGYKFGINYVIYGMTH